MTIAQRDSKSAPEAGDSLLIYDRLRQRMVEEKVLGDALMRSAYLGPMSPLLRRLFFTNGVLTRFMGWYANTSFSRRRIDRTIEELGIDINEFLEEPDAFRTFNDFFTRRLRPDARAYDSAVEIVSSPADCRLLVYPRLQEGLCVPVKGCSYTVADLFGTARAQDADRFRDGCLAVCRLCPADYHRYHFPASGRTAVEWTIDGRLDSVNPLALALGIPVFAENCRHVSLLDLGTLGEVAFIEVGAFGVAGIVTTHKGEQFAKMDEKGYFKFGGSTIILVFASGDIVFDDDLIERSAAGIETRVLAGMQIARMQHPGQRQEEGRRTQRETELSSRKIGIGL